MGKSLTGKKLDRGITQRKDGRYMARFTDRFGKRVTIYDDDLTILKKKFRELQYENDTKQNTITSDMTLNQWFDVYLNTLKVKLKPLSKKDYQVRYNRVKAELGDKKLKSIKQIDIQKALNNLKTDTSRRSTQVVLIDAFNYAIKNDLIKKNPATDTETVITKDEKKEKRILTDEEIELLYEIKSSLYPLLVIGLGTGMRIGEVLGLCWDCVDFLNNVIYVKRNLVYLPIDKTYTYRLSTPKSRTSVRMIPMTARVREVLIEQHKRKQEIERNYTAEEEFKNLVFVSRSNKPLCETNMNRMINVHLRRIEKKFGVKIERFSYHSLRHTFATRCINKGIKQTTVQKYLGHSTISTTIDMYYHVTTDTLFEEMKLLDEMPANTLKTFGVKLV